MSQSNGTATIHTASSEYEEWLQRNGLTKFLVPLRDSFGIDTIASCSIMDIADIPHICDNIPKDVKLKFGISPKDELILQMHLRTLLDQQKSQQAKREDKIARNVSNLEIMCSNKLMDKQKEIKSLVNKIGKQEKRVEQEYQDTLKKCDHFFSELHSKLESIYNNIRTRIKHEYERNYLLKHKQLKQDVSNVSREMETIKNRYLKSLTFESVDRYKEECNNLDDIGETNVFKMQSAIAKYESLDCVKIEEEEKSLNVVMDEINSFLDKCQCEMECIDRLNGLDEWLLKKKQRKERKENKSPKSPQMADLSVRQQSSQQPPQQLQRSETPKVTQISQPPQPFQTIHRVQQPQHPQHPQQQAQRQALSQQHEELQLKEEKKEEKKEVNKKNKNKIERLTDKDLKDLCSEMVNLNDDKKFDFDPQSAAPVMLMFIF